MMNLLSFFKKSRNWQLIGTTSTDPQIVPESVVGKVTDDVIQKILFGTTTYIWEEQNTHEVKKIETLGSEETPLRQLLARVDTWGKYEILLDGKKYLVMKLQEDAVLPVVQSLPPDMASPNSPTTIAPLDVSRLPVR